MLSALGAVFSCWRISRKEEKAVALFLSELWKFVRDNSAFHVSIDDSRFQWLHCLVKAAEIYLNWSNEDQMSRLMLVDWGRRRAKAFIAMNLNARPLLGLSSLAIQRSLISPNISENGIAYYRAVAQEMGLTESDALIRYGVIRDGVCHYEFATAIPHVRASPKRSLDGIARTESVHCRWLLHETVKIPSVNDDLHPEERHHVCRCKWCNESCECRPRTSVCLLECHPGENRECQYYGKGFWTRKREIEDLREMCYFAAPRDLVMLTSTDVYQKESWEGRKRPQSNRETFFWEFSPPLYHGRKRLLRTGVRCPSTASAMVSCDCLENRGQIPADVCGVDFELCHGDAFRSALFLRTGYRSASIETASNDRLLALVRNAEEAQINLDKAHQIFEHENLNHQLLSDYLLSLIGDNGTPLLRGYARPPEHLAALTALDMASQLYGDLAGSTISLRVLSQPLQESKWASSLEVIRKILFSGKTNVLARNTSFQHTLQENFSCFALFESGTCDIEPKELEAVIALATANSIFVASRLLEDPDRIRENYNQIRRVVGNIGRPGMSMLVVPQREPRIRVLSHKLRVLPEEYNFKREDNFASTSLHLSFTNWKRPISSGDRGAIDEEVSLVEAVVSVRDRGIWVADLDVFRISYEEYQTSFLSHRCICGDQGDPGTLTLLDHWEEVLDAPDNVGIVRSRSNWVARLAATAIRSQQGKAESTLIVSESAELCFKCLPARWLEVMGTELGLIID